MGPSPGDVAAIAADRYFSKAVEALYVLQIFSAFEISAR